MNKPNIMWARLATFGALFSFFGICIYASFFLNPWISGLIAGIMAVLITIALNYWSSFYYRNKIGIDSSSNSGTNNLEVNAVSLTAFKSLRNLLQIHTEKEILEILLLSGMDVLESEGASFIPYDEWGQSLPSLTHGQVPGSVLQTWTEHLTSPETRQICKNCKAFHGNSDCVLISSKNIPQKNVRCFPFKSGGREVGVLNYYFTQEIMENNEVNRIFFDIIDAAGIALENLHSKDQELAALLYLQTINSPKSDLSILLNSLLENIQRALDVDFVFLYLPDSIPGRFKSSHQFFSRTRGTENQETPIPSRAFLEGIWKSVLVSGHSLSLENVIMSKNERWKTLLAVPLVWLGDEPEGVLVLGSNNTQAFTQRHQALLETLAGQAALLIQNARLMMQVEYQAVVDERSRLAREIHDGLAQTLAFLKIQAAQMQNFLARGETDKLNNTLQANYRTLSDAYIDARQAIDDLRRVPTSNLRDWIGQVASDFGQSTNLKVNVSIAEFIKEYPANIQAQLIRIVQEALSNIRKHAEASSVNILGFHDGDSYVLEIRDNGQGFNPDAWKVDEGSHYGLRGMRERSESIGADFQIISQPGKGASVSLRVPVSVKEIL